jgi:excisionase family DNA binding protein
VSEESITITADEVAELLGIARKTVYEAAGRGDIPCRRLGRRVLFSRRVILQWLEQSNEP